MGLGGCGGWAAFIGGFLLFSSLLDAATSYVFEFSGSGFKSLVGVAKFCGSGFRSLVGVVMWTGLFF